MNVKEKNQKFFTQKLQKPTIEQEKIQTKKRKIQSNCMSHSPLTNKKKNYIKLLPYLQSKKVIEKDLKLTISEKSLKHIEKKLKLLYTNQQH